MQLFYAMSSALRCLLLFSVVFFQFINAAINIEPTYLSAVNDRFANDAASFIAQGYDLSGVARADDGRWVTMISPNIFLSAYHHRPSNGTNITFYQTNDPAGNSFTSSVQSTQRIENTDIVVGYLNTALPASYATYDIFGLEINGGIPNEFYNYPISGISAFMFGVSPTNYGSNSLNMSVGVNVLEGFVPQVDVVDSSVTDVVVTFQDGSPAEYEGQLRGGDSGGPLFAIVGNSLSLVGINWFIGSVTLGDVQTEYSAMSYLPNYADEIGTILVPVPVPEPSGLAQIFGLFALGYCFLNSRRTS